MDMPDMPSEGIWRWERRVYPQKISTCSSSSSAALMREPCLPGPLRQPVPLVELLGHAARRESGDVPGRDDAQHTPAIDDHQMAEAARVHAANGVLHRLLGADGLGVRGHDVAQLGRREVQAGGSDPDEEVALGEDAELAIVLDDEDAAATLLGHAFGRDAHRLVGAGADKVGAGAAAVEDGVDGTPGHVALPDIDVRLRWCRSQPL